MLNSLNIVQESLLFVWDEYQQRTFGEKKTYLQGKSYVVLIVNMKV